MAASNGATGPDVCSGTAFVQDPTLLKAYSALKTVQMMGIADTHLSVRVPMIVVCGTQSSGKTSFIETLIGFPVGHTDRGTATRCPVRYILRSGEPAYRVNGKAVGTRQGVRTAQKEHMMELGREGKIVPDVLLVEIAEPTMIDLDITDLPGLKTRDEPDYKPLADIARGFLQDSSVMPVVMCKASESHQTQHDLDSMRDLGLPMSRSLVVMNYFNKHLYDMSHISDVNKYCSGQRSKYPLVRFVMLHYKDGISKDRMSFEELSEYYRTLAKEEEAAFEEKVNGMQADAQLDPAVRKCFGVNSAFIYMQRQLHDWMRRHHAEVQAWLQERLVSIQGQLEELRASLEQQDPKRIAQMWRSYILDFERIMAAVHSATLTNVRRLSRESPFAPKYQWAFTMDEAGVTTTYDAERALVESAPPEHWLSSEQLREELPGTHTGTILDDSLSSHAALDRLMLVASYMIMALPMRPFTKDEIRSKSEHSRDGTTHSFNKHTVVKQLVTERLFHVQSILGELMMHIRAIYEAPLPKVHEALRENYPVVSRHLGFLQQLDDKFKKLLMGYLETANSSMQDVIEERTRFFGVDLPNRLLTLMALSPLRQDVLLEDTQGSYEKEEDEGLLDTLATEIAEDPSVSGIMSTGVRLFTGALRKTPVVLGRDKNPDIPERIAKQRKAVLSVKKALHTNHPLFYLVDFVEGGLQDLTQDEYRCPNVDEINKDGEQYFLILKGLITLDIEAKLDRYVYEPFKNKLLLGAMTSEMIAVVDDITQDEFEMSRITGNDAAVLAEALHEKEEQASMIKDALEQLKGIDRKVGPETFEGELQQQRAGPGPLSIRKVGVDGIVRFPNMELCRLPSAFRSNFTKAVLKDLSQHFAHPPALTKISGPLRAGSILVDYVLEARSKDELPKIQATVDRAYRRRMIFAHAGRVYCQAIGTDVTSASVFGRVDTRVALGSGPEVGEAEQERARVEAEAKAKAEADGKAQVEADAKARMEGKARATAEAEAAAKAEAEATANFEAERKAKAEAAEEKLRAEAAEKAKAEAEAKANHESEEKARAEAEAKAQAEAAEKAKAEAEAKAKHEAEEKARAEAEAKAQAEAAEKAQAEAEAKAKFEAEEKARAEAEDKAKAEAAEKAEAKDQDSLFFDLEERRTRQK